MMTNRSNRRRQNPDEGKCLEHAKAIGSRRAKNHYGPASTYANLKGRIYVRSRAYRRQTDYLHRGGVHIRPRAVHNVMAALGVECGVQEARQANLLQPPQPQYPRLQLPSQRCRNYVLMVGGVTCSSSRFVFGLLVARR